MRRGTYGSFARSARVGRRLGPTTASSSSRAFFWMLGYTDIAWKNAQSVACVYRSYVSYLRSDREATWSHSVNSSCHRVVSINEATV